MSKNKKQCEERLCIQKLFTKQEEQYKKQYACTLTCTYGEDNNATFVLRVPIEIEALRMQDSIFTLIKGYVNKNSKKTLEIQESYGN